MFEEPHHRATECYSVDDKRQQDGELDEEELKIFAWLAQN